MKIIDRNGRLFGAVSVIDVLVVAVVVVMAAALYFKSIQAHTGACAPCAPPAAVSLKFHTPFL